MRKHILIIFPFVEMPYAPSDLEYMMPGIIHHYFDNSDYFFDELILEYIMPVDKGRFELEKSYYQHMAEYVITYLKSLDFEHHLKKLIGSYWIEEAEIINSKHLILRLSSILEEL